MSREGREAWQLIFGLLLEGHLQGRVGEACEAMGLSPGLLKALVHLRPGEGVPMRDLAGSWGCDASYVTSLADALEERGLAKRRPHPTDRRVKMIVLTQRGVRARKRALEMLSEPPVSFGVLTAGEERRLRDLLGKVAAAEARPSSPRAAAAR